MRLSLLILFSCWLFPFTAHALVNSTEVSDAEFVAEFPWTVALVHPGRDRNACGAVLIAPEWVLTAAHCLQGKTVALVGHADRRKAQSIKITRKIIHPEYSKGPRSYDIALVQLAEPVAGQYVSIPTESVARKLIVPGGVAELLGWGFTETLDPPIYRLRRGWVKLNGLQLKESVLTYQYQGGGPCALDSGGPMLMQMPDGLRYVVGIASGTAGNLCEKNGGKAFYTHVVSARPFILEHIENLN
jgi:secreted trypsin-like serine protease